MLEPPSLLIAPFKVAELDVQFVAEAVVTVGTLVGGITLNWNSLDSDPSGFMILTLHVEVSVPTPANTLTCELLIKSSLVL